MFLVSGLSSLPHQRNNNKTKEVNAEIRTQAEGGREKFGGVKKKPLLWKGAAKKTKRMLMPWRTHKQKNKETKVKAAEIRTSEEGTEQRSGKNDMYISCEQSSSDGQTIESEAPENEGLQ